MEKKQKRILVIGLTERMGGVETFIYNTTVFSNPQKYEYDYLVHGTSKCVYEKEINNFYHNGKHIHFVRSFRKNMFGCLYDLIKFYKNNGNKYDYVHLQTGATFEVVYIFPFCYFFKLKVISHSHSANEYAPIQNAMFRPVLNLITNKKIACSRFAADWLFGKNKKEKNIIILNNGIDTDRFIFDKQKRDFVRKKYNITNDELVIGHVGRFSVEKNHKFIIQIFKKILEKRRARLFLIGDGIDREEIFKFCKKMKVLDFVIFTGRKLSTEDYYCAFDTFLMPSLHEGLPLVGIEAQSEGLYCFFSDTIDAQIKITDRVKVLSLNDSPEEWAKQILLIDQSTTGRQSYAKKVENAGYSIRKTVEKLEVIYDC